jgi:hypothetical protein
LIPQAGLFRNDKNPLPHPPPPVAWIAVVESPARKNASGLVPHAQLGLVAGAAAAMPGRRGRSRSEREEVVARIVGSRVVDEQRREDGDGKIARINKEGNPYRADFMTALLLLRQRKYSTQFCLHRASFQGITTKNR